MQPLTSRDPARIGPYTLTHRLGAGGMGQVYLGTSPSGRLVAVKLVHPEFAADPGFRARFRHEVHNARAVTGFYTAPVVDADPDAEQPWLATAYIAGPSLHEAVVGRGPLPAVVLRGLAAGLAEALAAIHAAGVIHRDLKPSNVLLAEDGPRVIDFGISRANEGSAVTRTRTTVGSAGYMAPEQVRSAQVGPQADVFALGATLVFAATSRGPFEGPDGPGPADAMLYRVVHEEADLTGVPEDLRGLIADCLAKDPGVRPTPHDVLARLGLDVGTRVMAPLASTTSAPATLIRPAAPTHEAPGSPYPRRPRRTSIAAVAAAALLVGGGIAWTLSHETRNNTAGSTPGPADSQLSETSTSSSTSAAKALEVAHQSTSSAPATQILTYQPWTPSGLSTAVSVETSTAGSCFGSSIADAARADAYRCFQDQNLIQDPCFADPYQTPVQDVACPSTPGKVVVLHLSQTLPSIGPATEVTPLPWLVVLSNAVQCTVLTGTTVVIDNQPVLYGCSGGGNLLGSPDISGPTWTIDYKAPGSSTYSQTVIATAYK